MDKLIPDSSKTLWSGAIDLLGPIRKIGRWKKHLYKGIARAIEEELELEKDTLLKTEWSELPEDARQLFLYGMSDRNITFEWRHSGGIWKHGDTYDGVVEELLESYRGTAQPDATATNRKVPRLPRLHGMCRGTPELTSTQCASHHVQSLLRSQESRSLIVSG